MFLDIFKRHGLELDEEPALWWKTVFGETGLYPHEAEKRDCSPTGNNPYADR